MSNNNFYCVIMAGGTGRRFWPYSRKALPKQFLDFFGSGKTLLEQTYERYRQIVLPENIYISTYRDYKDIVLNLLPEMEESRLIVEEEHRNTAPAIALRVGTDTSGIDRADARPFADAIAILSPVNEPGPFVTAAILISLIVMPALFSMHSISWSRFSEGENAPHMMRSSYVFSVSSAITAASDDVSNAMMFNSFLPLSRYFLTGHH